MRWDGTKWRSAGSGTDGHSFYLLQNNLVFGEWSPNTGRIAANEIAELSFTGEHSIVYESSNLSSSVYFYCSTTPTFSQTRTMVIIK
jgi:hypothetical protein